MIPKEGANTFRGMFFSTFTHSNLQANNLDEQQIAAGLRDPNLVDEVWSLNPNVGGPIFKDRLWFFAAHSTQRANIYPAGVVHWTANPTGLPLVKDFNYRVLDTSTAHEQSVNLTWQAMRRDKVKFYWTNSSTDQDVYLQGRTLGSIFVAPEAAILSAIDTNTYQVAWSRPHTNRLLFEAGFSHEPVEWTFLPADRAVSSLPGALTIGPTVAIRNMGGWLQGGATSRVSPRKIIVSWFRVVRDRHSQLQVGMSRLRQWTYVTQESNSTPPWTTTTYAQGSVPILASFSGAFEQAQEAWTWGLYAQDQWRLDRLTMNLGVRWDYNTEGYPDQTRPVNIYFAEPLDVPGETVVTWKDPAPAGRRVTTCSATGRRPSSSQRIGTASVSRTTGPSASIRWSPTAPTAGNGPTG